MQKCKTCKYYNPDRGSDETGCVCPKMVYGYSRLKPKSPDDVRVESDEGWGMIPGPEFGCIHHASAPSLGGFIYDD